MGDDGAAGLASLQLGKCFDDYFIDAIKPYVKEEHIHLVQHNKRLFSSKEELGGEYEMHHMCSEIPK